MPKSMYDKLGDLLSRTLDEGEIPFVKVKIEDEKDAASGLEDGAGSRDEDTGLGETAPGSQGEAAGLGGATTGSQGEASDLESEVSGSQGEATGLGGTAPGSRDGDAGLGGTAPGSQGEASDLESEFEKYRGKKSAKKTYTIYKYVPPEIEKCYSVLGIRPGADRTQIKAAYKKQLKLLHPDKNSAGGSLEKDANERTEQVVDAYKKILLYLKG